MRPSPPLDRLPLPGRLPFALALRRRPRLRRALAVVLAVAVGLAVTATVRRADAARAAWGRGTEVVVVARDLPAGHELEGGDTEVRTLPEPAVPEGAVRSAPAGRVLRSAVYAGEVLVRGRLGREGATGAAALVPEGARAVAVPVQAGSAPSLAVGQRVDVVGIVAVDGQPEAVVLAPAAPVVEVGELAVSVAVDPEVVPLVATALAAGTVTLAVVGG